jgi:hypothetical protein
MSMAYCDECERIFDTDFEGEGFINDASLCGNCFK